MAQRSESLAWEFELVESGYEHIKIARGRKVRFEGRVPAGFSKHLSVGDTVLQKPLKNMWRLKFAIKMHNDRAVIQVGPYYDKIGFFEFDLGESKKRVSEIIGGGA